MSVDFSNRSLFMKLNEQSFVSQKKIFPPKPLVNATSSMASTPNKLATQAADKIFALGGNAMDAAIAAQFVLSVVTPEATGLGGGGFISVFDKSSGKPIIYDARETAPALMKETEYEDKNGKTPSYLNSVAGGRTVGVPSLVKGLKKVHENHGKLDWKELLKPAIDIAENGFEMPKRLHDMIKKRNHYSRLSPLSKRYFRDDGSVKAVGEIVKNPELANSLKSLSNGIENFYTGKIAQDIIDTATQTSVYPSKMSLDDLKNYNVIKRDALSVPYKDYTLHVPPAPSSGGVAVVQALKILEPFQLEKYDANDMRLTHLITQALRLAYEDRNTYIGDPQFTKFDEKNILSDSYIEKKRERLKEIMKQSFASNDEKSSFSKQFDQNNLNANTSHSSFMDSDGNGVALTSSVEFGFGSGLETQSGFILNSTMSDFTIDGHKTGSVNKIAPLKRPRSAMCPIIITHNRDKDIKLIAGSPGGPAIIGFLVEKMIDILDHGIKPNIALARPNYLAMDKGNVVEIEDSVTTDQEKNFLKREAKLDPKPTKLWLSGLQMIIKDAGFLSGASDPRRDGIDIGRS